MHLQYSNSALSKHYCSMQFSTCTAHYASRDTHFLKFPFCYFSFPPRCSTSSRPSASLLWRSSTAPPPGSSMSTTARKLLSLLWRTGTRRTTMTTCPGGGRSADWAATYSPPVVEPTGMSFSKKNFVASQGRCITLRIEYKRIIYFA